MKPKKGKFAISWIDRGREPKHPPNPDYPNGIDLVLAKDPAGPRCYKQLAYPARRCGHYVIICETCNQTAVVTTAGRPDDPRSVTLDCMVRAH